MVDAEKVGGHTSHTPLSWPLPPPRAMKAGKREGYHTR